MLLCFRFVQFVRFVFVIILLLALPLNRCYAVLFEIGVAA